MSRRTAPAVGMIEPTSIRPSVDLPVPDEPTMAIDSPGSSVKLTPFRMTFLLGGGT